MTGALVEPTATGVCSDMLAPPQQGVLAGSSDQCWPAAVIKQLGRSGTLSGTALSLSCLPLH